MTTPIHIDHSDVNQYIRASISNLSDTNEVHELILQTARWLHSKGSTQWGGLLNGHDDHNLSGAVKRNEVICFRDTQTGELAASVILQQQPSEWDRNLWGLTQDDPGSSVYLHRLVVNRRYGRTGLGQDILTWVESGITYPGKDRIRLDCIASNEILNSFYRRCGYTYKGEVNGLNIYEKMFSGELHRV